MWQALSAVGYQDIGINLLALMSDNKGFDRLASDAICQPDYSRLPEAFALV